MYPYIFIYTVLVERGFGIRDVELMHSLPLSLLLFEKNETFAKISKVILPKPIESFDETKRNFCCFWRKFQDTVHSTTLHSTLVVYCLCTAKGTI